MYQLKLKHLGWLPDSIYLISRADVDEYGNRKKGTAIFETHRIMDYLDCEIYELRWNSIYHTVVVFED